MASIPYFVLSPSAIACIIGYLHGPDRSIPTPAEDYRNAVVDVIIPAHNEEKNIVLALESLVEQTLKPAHIFVVDDGSNDKTSEIAKGFAAFRGMNITLYRKEVSEGKTPALSQVCKESTADVIFVLDADTILRSNNYIETLVKELFQGVGIASACGIILPEFDKDRTLALDQVEVRTFAEKAPEITVPRNITANQKLQQVITNYYREELYLFLQKFIYHGEMTFFGSIINPVGCAVAYRRKYLLDLLEYYHAKFGHNLTTSEDIFIGFALAAQGYRNVQVNDIYALTCEPRLFRLPKQILLWSSSYLQSCYYFDDLVRTPFKVHRVIWNSVKLKFTPKDQRPESKRKIVEAYRQSFSPEVTKKYGRPIGWFIFTSLLEKVTFPTILIIMMILGLWEAVTITVLAEVVIYTIIIAMMHKNRRIRNVLKSLCLTPLRYIYLAVDFGVTLNFAKDLWITKNREWRK